jgi:hypothetical protein
MNCSGNYDGSNAIGNGEVDSSILSGSTIPAQRILRPRVTHAFIACDHATRDLRRQGSAFFLERIDCRDFFVGARAACRAP